MKFNYIIYLYLCFVFILSEDNVNLQKGKITLEAYSNHKASFVFDASKFRENEDIYFKVKSVENNFNTYNDVNYIYVSSQSDTPESSAAFKTTRLTGTEKETLENTTVFDVKYFKIKKQSSEYDSHDGKYIYIIIYINSGYVEVINTAKDTSTKPTTAPNDVMDGIVKQYGSITVDASEYMVVFNVGGFDNDEEMYFKIKAERGTFYYRYIYYEYISSDIGYEDRDAKTCSFSLKTTYETSPNGIDYETNYFTITKKRGEFRGTDGTYLIINFFVDYGDVTITNTEEDEGKIETWVIIVIVVAVVIVIAIVIVVCCIMRKRRLNAMNRMNANGQVGQYVTPTNVAIDPNVQYQQNYIYSNNY